MGPQWLSRMWMVDCEGDDERDRGAPPLSRSRLSDRGAMMCLDVLALIRVAGKRKNGIAFLAPDGSDSIATSQCKHP